MTETTWDPSDTGGWTFSNGDLTATSPDNNTMQSVFVAYANVAIPDDAKTYFDTPGIRRRGQYGLHRGFWRARLQSQRR